MGIPDYLLSQTVTVVKPATSADTHGNTVNDYGGSATRVVLAPGGANGGAWLQQDQRQIYYPDGREPAEQRWLIMCNYAGLETDDRIEWAEHPSGSMTFTVEGPPEPAYTPDGYHHTEATLRVLTG